MRAMVVEIGFDDPARVLIHDHQDPVGPQRGRLAPEQIHVPETIFHVAEETARRDHRSPVPAGSDGRESCGCGTPRPGRHPSAIR